MLRLAKVIDIADIPLLHREKLIMLLVMFVMNGLWECATSASCALIGGLLYIRRH